MHASHAARLRALAAASREAWADTYRQLVMFDLPRDAQIGLMLSYYRSFAVPSIARTLHHSGAIKSEPRKRSVDTALILYELIDGELQSDRALEMIDLLVSAHRHVKAPSEDFLYVLFSLAIVPMRWIEKHGWRALTLTEQVATIDFYANLGRAMGLSNVPEDVDAATSFYRSYEENRIAWSREGQELTDWTVGVIRSTMPKPVRPFARLILSTWIGDKRVSQALGLPRTNAFVSALSAAAMSVRNRLTARAPRPASPRFVQGVTGSAQYPHGYSLTDLGAHR